MNERPDSPDRKLFLTIMGHDLGVRPPAAGEPRRVTLDGTPDYRWSVANAIWSPDCKHVALAKLDERAVYACRWWIGPAINALLEPQFRRKIKTNCKIFRE
jgi:hypothetical protein